MRVNHWKQSIKRQQICYILSCENQIPSKLSQIIIYHKLISKKDIKYVPSLPFFYIQITIYLETFY